MPSEQLTASLTAGQGIAEWRMLVAVGLTGFFTLIDLFGPQAMAPVLADSFAASAPRIGVAINAAIAGMIGAGLVSTLFADRFGRKPAMITVLLLLTIPSVLLAVADHLVIFELLRISQGFLMCIGFTVAIAYVAEEWGASGVAPLMMGAYLTGNVAANLFGRLIAGAAVQCADWRVAFLLFALLNLAGAVLLQGLLPPSRRQPVRSCEPLISGVRVHLRNPVLCGAFIAGFFILFTFVGVFTYVNFRLATPPFELRSGAIGLVYLVFAPALLITPAVGRTVQLFGYRTAFLLGAFAALAGSVLMLAPELPVMLLGLVLVGSGLFFSQAVTTGFTGNAAAQSKAAASGLYLASYYTGGLGGAWVFGAAFASLGWTGCVIAAITGIGAMLAAVALSWAPRASPMISVGSPMKPKREPWRK